MGLRVGLGGEKGKTVEEEWRKYWADASKLVACRLKVVCKTGQHTESGKETHR